MSTQAPYLLIAVVGFLLSFLFFVPKSVLAVSIDISNTPIEITDQSFSIDVIVTGNISNINYLRIDLYKEGTNNYFGETYNGNSWYNGSDGSQYLPITLSEKVWHGSLMGKVGSPSSTRYPGPGLYKLKIRRYTSPTNYSSSDQQTPPDVQINLAVSTPTPSPTPTPKPTPSPTKTPAPTTPPKPSATPKSTPITTPTLSLTILPAPSPKPSLTYKIASVAGASKSANPISTPQPTDVKSQKQLNLFPIVGLVLIISGLSSLGYLYFRRKF